MQSGALGVRQLLGEVNQISRKAKCLGVEVNHLGPASASVPLHVA